jgi:hypothetical protein
VLVLTAVIVVIALGAAFARRTTTRRSCARTLDQMLRVIPWYRPADGTRSTPRDPWN